jgi:hypothetical protein
MTSFGLGDSRGQTPIQPGQPAQPDSETVLREQVQQLTNQIQQMQTYIQSQQSALSQPPTITYSAADPRINPPAEFSGDRRKARDFILQVRHYLTMQASRFQNDSQRVIFLTSYLRGSAYSWAATYHERNDPIVSNFEAFVREFTNMFADPDRRLQAEKALLRIKQGSSPMPKLVAEFQQAAADASWPSESLFPVFYSALNEDVKDEICKTDRPPTIEEYYQLAIRIDRRLYERRQEKRLPRRHADRPQQFAPRPPAPDPNAMQIDSIQPTNRRGKLTQDERQRRFDNNLCLYCGGANHKVSDCPIRTAGNDKSRQ